jgi:hypothetical protein
VLYLDCGQINRSISKFLSENRHRNSASNRAEFLLSLEEKRKRFDESGDSIDDTFEVSCARVDAKPLEREIQMKYDIAKNEHGPLRRTLRKRKDTAEQTGDETFSWQAKAKQQRLSGVDSEIQGVPEDQLTEEHHPGIHERLRNIETHFSIKYGVTIYSYLITRSADYSVSPLST